MAALGNVDVQAQGEDARGLQVHLLGFRASAAVPRVEERPILPHRHAVQAVNGSLRLTLAAVHYDGRRARAAHARLRDRTRQHAAEDRHDGHDYFRRPRRRQSGYHHWYSASELCHVLRTCLGHEEAISAATRYERCSLGVRDERRAMRTVVSVHLTTVTSRKAPGRKARLTTASVSQTAIRDHG